MNLREVRVDMGKKGNGLLHFGRSCVGDLFCLLYFIMGHCWYMGTCKFYVLVLYSATLLLSFIRAPSLSENQNGLSI